MGILVEMQGASALLQELYEADIDASLTSMARHGFIAEIGVDGEIADAVHVDSYDQACAWLTQAAVRLYPSSPFARKYGNMGKLVTMPAPRQQPAWTS